MKAALKPVITPVFINPFPQRDTLSPLLHPQTDTMEKISTNKNIISKNLELLLRPNIKNDTFMNPLFNRLVDQIEYTNTLTSTSDLLSPYDSTDLDKNTVRRELTQHIVDKYQRGEIELEDENQSVIIYDLGNIIRQCHLWYKLMPEVTPYYAVKSGPHENIISAINLNDINTFDCASSGEFDLINNTLNSNINNVSIGYSHCVKPKSTLKRLDNEYTNIDYTTFDSIEELEKIVTNTSVNNKNLFLRIQVNSQYSKYHFNEKFGCNDEEIFDLLEYGIKKLGLNINGLMFHIGCNYSNPIIYIEALNKCYNIINECKLRFNHEITTIDMGGGFPGIKNHFGHETPDFIEISKLITKHINNNKSLNINYIAEPGRFFHTNSGTIVYNVIGKREKTNETQYFISDSVYQNCSYVSYEPGFVEIIPYNNFRHNLPILYNEKPSTIFGWTCDSVDVIFRNKLNIPLLNVGDICLGENFGSYSWNLGTEFNGFKKPKLLFMLSV